MTAFQYYISLIWLTSRFIFISSISSSSFLLSSLALRFLSVKFYQIMKTIIGDKQDNAIVKYWSWSFIPIKN